MVDFIITQMYRGLFTLSTQLIKPNYLIIFKCWILHWFWSYAVKTHRIQVIKCLLLFTDYTEAMVKTNQPTSPSDDKNLDIILPIVFVCLFIIVVCVIVFVLWQRRQKKRDAVDNAHALSHKGSMTMRDRLRAESLKSLDSRLLRLYDPNKLRQYRLDHVQYVKDLGEGFFGKVFQGNVECGLK